MLENGNESSFSIVNATYNMLIEAAKTGELLAFELERGRKYYM